MAGDKGAVCSTAQAAAAVGVHPNTVRFYEEMGLLPPVERRPNGYRVFHEGHLAQLRLIRTGFRSEILAADLRQQVIDILKAAAAGGVEKALAMTEEYQGALAAEKARAAEAICLAEGLALGRQAPEPAAEAPAATRGQAARELGVSADVLRDWERNGLATIPRLPGGQRRYGPAQMERLKIIRILRNAHYSTMAILRMLDRLDAGGQDMRHSLDTPGEEEDVVRATDRYMAALCGAQADARQMADMLHRMG